MKILIVEDEERIRSFVVPYLNQSGYEVDEAETGEAGLELAAKNSYSMVLLDLMLPGIDGHTVCAELRKSSRVPILMLTAKSEEEDILTGFESGADDYLTKPFSPRELLARVKALHGRSYPAPVNSAIVSGALSLRPESQTAALNGTPIPLTPKEFDLLLILMKNPNIIYSREQLLADVWGYEFLGDSRTVDTHIKQLRDKLGEYRDRVVTVWGKGYKWITDSGDSK